MRAKNGRSSTWPWRTRRRLGRRITRPRVSRPFHYLNHENSHANSTLTLAEIVNGVELPQEGVSNDPKGSNRSRDVHAGKGRDTSTSRVQDVLATLERVLLVVERQGEVGERVDGGAVDGVLAVPGLGSSDPGRSRQSGGMQIRKCGLNWIPIGKNGLTACATARRCRWA